MHPKLKGYLTLMRPANIITAIADILLGYAAGGGIQAFLVGEHLGISSGFDLLMLGLATMGLYGGGVVMNDVFDAELDAIERPERPIPSGLIPLKSATIFGILLLFLGIAAASMVGMKSTLIAIAIAAAAVWYDAYGKHHNTLGPINMGICRGLNLWLGMSAFPWNGQWLLLLIPILYIGGITTISRGEVHGKNRRELWTGFLLYLVVIAMVLFLSKDLGQSWPFLLLFMGFIFPPLVRALQDPQPQHIGKAVKFGVLALIILDATLAVGFTDWKYGLAIVLLLPISLFLGKLFAVT